MENQDPNVSSLLEQLKNRCDQIKEKIEETHYEISKKKQALQTNPNTNETAESKPIKIRVLEEKLKLFESARDSLHYKTQHIEVSPSTQEPQIIKAMMLEELTRMNEEYDQTLQYIQQQCQVERAMISSAQQLKIELTQLDTTLTDMHSQIDRALEDLNGSYAQPADYVPAIYTKHRDLLLQQKEYLRQSTTSIMKPFAAFMTKHFPPPSQESEQSSPLKKRKLEESTGSQTTAQSNFIPLKKIVEALMNKALISPHDPYVDVSRVDFWPGHIDKLDEAGLIERHEQNPNMIKIVDFHR
jgi:regulator of replication initiation timing